jgi:hypothetical protein
MSMFESDYVTASFDTLLNQASMTASDYLAKAKLEIDKAFGEGYAAKNPALVAAFMQTCAADMGAATNAKVLGTALQEIARSLDGIADAVRDK